MARIVLPPIEAIAAKWARVTPTRAEDFEAGVRNPRRSWSQNTLAAAKSFADGIQVAIREKRFEKGVSATGDSGWQEPTISKGVQRWGPGVQLAEAKFAQKFSKFASALAAVDLPPRFARRDPRNLERVRVVVEAMINAAKTTA